MTAVVAQHCHLLPFGWAGVWLFFVISGYVVTLTVIRRPPEKPLAGFVGFLRRRALRIFPIYYGYVAAGLLLALALGWQIHPGALLSLGGFFYNVVLAATSMPSPNWPTGHLWTISVEMQFYLFYGVALFFLPRRVLVGLLVATLFIVPLLRFAASTELAARGWSNQEAAFAIYSAPVLQNDSFALGALLAFANHRRILDRLARPLMLVGIAFLSIYFLVYVEINRVIDGAAGVNSIRNILSGILFGQHREVFAYSCLALACAGLVAVAASGRSTILNGLLGHRALQRIGEISYGAYVLHWLLLTTLTNGFGWLTGMPFPQESIGARTALFLVLYCLTIAAAELSYRYFESRFTGRSKPAKEPAPGLTWRMSPQFAAGERFGVPAGDTKSNPDP